jgi:hypothetical protein
MAIKRGVYFHNFRGPLSLLGRRVYEPPPHSFRNKLIYKRSHLPCVLYIYPEAGVSVYLRNVNSTVTYPASAYTHELALHQGL